MTYRINDLLRALEGYPLHQWEESLTEIATERSLVESWLDNGGYAYGFSTFLGHLDNHPINEKDSRAILDAHLIGSEESYPFQLIRALTIVKLCQWSQGGSGVSPQTYQQVLSSFGQESDADIPLSASYGSGDVVPGSWWASTVMGDMTLHKGDVIALINGNFVSAGTLLYHWSKIIDTISDAQLRCMEVMALLNASVDHVQAAVSTRDPGHLTSVVKTSINRLQSALLDTVNSQSANPMFIPGTYGGVVCESNSSFLNFPLSYAVAEMTETVKLLSAYTKSVTSQLASSLEKDKPAVQAAVYVQYPKVSKAYFDQVNRTSNSVDYLQNESGGVEDISDGCLSRVLTLVDVSEVLDKQVALLDSLLAIRDN